MVTPLQIGNNPRAVKEADALHEAGHSVTAIAPRMRGAAEIRDQALMRRIVWHLDRVDLRSQLRWKLLRVGQTAAGYAYAMTGLAPAADVGFAAYTRPLRRAALATPADLYIAHYV